MKRTNYPIFSFFSKLEYLPNDFDFIVNAREKLITFGIANWSSRRVRLKRKYGAKQHRFSIWTEMLSTNAIHFTENSNAEREKDAKPKTYRNQQFEFETIKKKSSE